MGFESWESFNDDLMELPWNGHVYRIPEMPAKVGAWLRVRDDPKVKTPLSKMTDIEQAEAVLGDAFHQMLADGAPDAMVARAAETAVADWLMGRATAEIVWRDGLSDPKELRDKIVRTLTRSTGVDDETPKPASSSGTTSPRKPRARKSPGRTSSSSGA